MADLGVSGTGRVEAGMAGGPAPPGYEWVVDTNTNTVVLRPKPTVINPITGATEYAPDGYRPPTDSTGAVHTTGPAIGGGTTGGGTGGSGGGSGSMDSLMSPQDQYRAEQAAALAQRNREQDRTTAAGETATAAELARTAEANRLRQADADRASREGLSAADAAARLKELQTGAALTDQNAANTTGRNTFARTQLMGQIPEFLRSITGEAPGTVGATPAGGGADPTAANAATFKAAGEKVGAIGQGSVDALRDASSERGGFGAGVEAGSIAALRGGNAVRGADVGRQATISSVDTANALANRNAAGALTKRGQDLGMTQSMLSLLGPRAY